MRGACGKPPEHDADHGKADRGSSGRWVNSNFTNQVPTRLIHADVLSTDLHPVWMTPA
jgi:hypothetical protein